MITVLMRMDTKRRKRCIHGGRRKGSKMGIRTMLRRDESEIISYI